MSEKPKNATKEKYTFKCFLHDFIFVTGAIPALLLFRPKWVYQNEEKKRVKGGAIFIGNHSGFFDPIYMMIAVFYRRQRFLTMKEMFNTKFKCWLFDLFFCIPVDRQNFRLGTFREVVGRLKKEQAITMFPEGHISGEELASFKSGMVLMAMTADKPIVPVYVKPRAHWYNRLVTVVGEPIHIREKYGDVKLNQMDEIAADIQNIEKTLQQYVEKKRR